jgi:hypothetical protein
MRKLIAAGAVAFGLLAGAGQASATTIHHGCTTRHYAAKVIHVHAHTVHGKHGTYYVHAYSYTRQAHTVTTCYP